MKFWTSDDGTKIAYEVFGEPSNPAVILQHGFASNEQAEWKATGIATALAQGGRYVIVMHARGHGASDKPHDQAFYGEERMALDLRGVADHEGLSQYALGGYSMGAVISLLVACADQRVQRLLVGGVGEGILTQGGVDTRYLPKELIAQALLADDANDLPPQALVFRAFAESTGGDLKALAAQATAAYQKGMPLDKITATTMVAAGNDDPLASNPSVLADAIPGAQCFVEAGGHMTVFANDAFRTAITQFLLASS